MNKKLVYLLNKYKNDKEGFMDAFISLSFKSTETIDIDVEQSIDAAKELNELLSEEMASAMDKNILAELFWLDKDNILKNGLRDDKLKRILGE
jgi:hypothetical protein